MTAMAAATAQLDIDDLVKAFASNHIGQQHIDIATIRDQLAQLLYSQSAAAAFQAQMQPQQQQQQQYAKAADNEPRKRCTSLASLDVSMEMECDEAQAQALSHFAPPNSPQRMHAAEHPFAAPAAHPAHPHPPAGLPAEPAPPPSSPVQPAAFVQRDPMHIAAPF